MCSGERIVTLAAGGAGCRVGRGWKGATDEQTRTSWRTEERDKLEPRLRWDEQRAMQLREAHREKVARNEVRVSPLWAQPSRGYNIHIELDPPTNA